MEKETFYQKICRYRQLVKDKNVEFLKHMFEYYEDYKLEKNIKVDEIKADNLAIYTAVRDYEKKFSFVVVN